MDYGRPITYPAHSWQRTSAVGNDFNDPWTAQASSWGYDWREASMWDAGWNSFGREASIYMTGDLTSSGQSGSDGRLPGDTVSLPGAGAAAPSAGAASTSVPTTRLAAPAGPPEQESDPWMEAARQLIGATTGGFPSSGATSSMLAPPAPPWTSVCPASAIYQQAASGAPVAPPGLPPGPGTPAPPRGPDQGQLGEAGQQALPLLQGPLPRGLPGPALPAGASQQNPATWQAHPGLRMPTLSVPPVLGGSGGRGDSFSTPGAWANPWRHPDSAAGGFNGGYKGDFSDPPTWPGWSYRRQWVTSVRRWDKQTDIPLFRRAEKVLRTLGWEMQVDFEHLTEEQLGSPRYLEYILQIIEMKAGVREDDERRQAYRNVMHDVGRRRDESLAQFAMRRLRDFTKAAAFGVQLPNEFKAAMLREGAGLSEQGLQNLTALMQGRDHDIDLLATTLARLDSRGDRVSGFVAFEDHAAPVFATELEQDLSEDHESDIPEEVLEDEYVLAELTGMNFTEEQAACIFAMVENRPPFRKRTWKENKRFKADIRKERGSFMKSGAGEEGHRPYSPGGRGRMTKEQLKKISKCNTCGKRGHWSEDCRQGGPSSSSTTGASAGSSTRLTGFCYLGETSATTTSASSHYTFAAWNDGEAGASLDGPVSRSWSFLTIPPGLAILDIGATQDIIGHHALSALESELGAKGLQPVVVPAPSAAPTGIGGQAQVLKAVLVPVAFGGVPGVVRFVVIEGHVPPLLSVGLLAHLGAKLDLESNEVYLKTIGVSLPMTRLPSGHRAIPLVQWEGGDFEVPEAAKEQYDLPKDAFMKPLVSSEYTNKGFKGQCVEQSADRPVEVHPIRSKSLKYVRFGSVEYINHSTAADHAAIHDGRCSAAHVMSEEENCASIQSSAAQMGNSLVPSGSQFDTPRDREHGSFVSSDKRREWCDLSCCTMAGGGLEDVPHVGDHSCWLSEAGSGGDYSEERLVGAAQVPHGRRSRAWPMPTPGCSDQASESVRELDGVSKMLGEDFVYSEIPPLQGEGQSKEERSRPHGNILCSSDAAFSGDLFDNSTADRTGGRDPSRAECHPAGHDGWIQGDDVLPAGSCSRTGPNAGHDATRHAIGCFQSDTRPDEQAGERDGCSADAGGRGERERYSHQLVPGATRTKSQRVRPPRGWPVRMTWCVAATQLISWVHMTEAFQHEVREKNGDEKCWVVYYPESSAKKDASSSSWMQRPWITSTSGLPQDDGRVLWHSQRDEHGQLTSQGPGPPRGPGSTTTTWSCPQNMVFLQENVDETFPLQGYDEDGGASPTGPFWLVRAPRLEQWASSPTTGELNLCVPLKEKEQAEKGLIRVAAQHQARARHDQVDFVEVFREFQVTPALREKHLRIAPPHEQFTDAAGWNVEEKEHRAKCRKFMERRCPTVVALSLRAREGDPVGREAVKSNVEGGFALEIVRSQVSSGREFYLEAPHDHEVWTSPPGRHLLDDTSLFVGRVDEVAWATNSSDLASFMLDKSKDVSKQAAKRLPDSRDFSTRPRTEGEMVPHEQTAKRLLDSRDFSMASCLRLLSSTTWPNTSRRRGDNQRSNVYLLLGQFTYGKFSGITKATGQLVWVTRYLNAFMTYHGASDPRSSLVVSSGSRIKYHKDINNVGMNHSIALGKFTGGGLWQEDESGAEVRSMPSGAEKRGRVVSHRKKLISFDPRRYHGVEPWEGTRWSITVYRTRSSLGLDTARADELRHFGFELDGYADRSPKVSYIASALVEASTAWATGVTPLAPSYPALQDDPDEQINEDEHDEEGVTADSRQESLSESQKSLVKKIHVNTGHPPRDRLLRTLKAAGAKPSVLKYVRDEFSCDVCAIRRGPDHRRKAQCPRTFAFNRVLSVDVFYVPFKGSSVPVLNMVCHGTGYHVAQRIEGTSGNPTASATWKAFVNSWLRFLGPPQMMVTDGGNEFRSVFERGLEQQGVLQHTTAPESPWQNSRAERHGGWLKQKLKQEIESGQLTLSSSEELDDFMAQLLAAKNRWFNSGGYTPTQLVFGELPRVPGELLSEDPGGLVPLSDAYRDPGGLDEAGAEFRRRNEIRERARQLAMQATSKEAIQRAVRSSMVPAHQWTPGQWVYCFRRGKAGDMLHPTPRWVGPGLVVLNTRSVIWVAMRTRLWRCSPEQLRPAFPSEVLGRELASDPALGDLLRQVVSGSQTGAVDVSKEGPPDESDHLRPIDRDPDGVPLSSGAQATPTAPESRPRPDEVTPVPPGILPASQIAPAQEPPPGGENVDPAASSRPSRRSSIQEPAQEPEVAEALDPVPEEEMHPSYRFPENEHSSAEPALDQRESKVQRTAESERSAVDAREARNEITGDASSSFLPDAGDSGAPAVRAPGTPIRLLLDAVTRGREAPSRQAPSVPEESLDDDLCQWFSMDEQGKFSYVASRSDEVNLKRLSDAEKKLFEQSDVLEWQAILKTKAVHVIRGREAELMRRRYPERVLSSRMVRRKKPQPGEGNWKAKSRWCIAGHEDPDTASLSTFSPTPATESIMAFLQVGLNLGHFFAFTDVKNAFCQSDRLRRPRGPIFAEPCEGLQLEPGSLIVIDAPVYGLDDAPAAWRNTVTKFLSEQGFVRNLVEPCYWMRFDSRGHNEAQVLIEVDDFIISCDDAVREPLRKQFETRFQFGKWEDGEAEYAGRFVKVTPDRILLHQEKYINEQIFPVALSKGRRSQKDSLLTQEEFQSFRSAVYKVNWVAKETRPEVCGTASLMASRLTKATVDDVIVLNKNINYLRSTSSRPLILWRHDPVNMAFLAVSDAGGTGSKFESTDEDGLPSDGTQGAWMVLAANSLPVGNQRVRASPLSWRSSKLRRKVFSTFGGETQAMLQAINEVDWLQIMIRDATQHDVELKRWRNSLSPHMLIMRGSVELQKQPQCSVTDAKSLYDCIMKEHPQGKQDRKSALELAIIVKDLRDSSSMVRWVPHQKMLVDALTKADPMKANGAMDQFLKSGTLSLVDVSEELKQRAQDSKFRNRSHAASVARLVTEYQQAAEMFWSTLIRGSCIESPVGDGLLC